MEQKLKTRAMILLPFAVVCAPALAGQMQLDTDFRYRLYDLMGETTDFPPDFFGAYVEGPPPVTFGNWDYTWTGTIPDAQIDASHSSSVNSNALTAQGAVTGSTVVGSTSYGLFGMVGFNDFQIRFSILEETFFHLDVMLNAFGDEVESQMRLRDLSDFSDIYTATTTNELVLVEESFSLGPGSYSFQIQSSIFIGSFPSEGSASYNGSLTLVPAQSALSLLAISGFCISRRRR